MRRQTWLVIGGVIGGLLGAAPGAPEELTLPPLPPFAEVEATWQALVEALSLGDREGLRQLTHSSRRHLLPDRLPPLVSEEAYQYGFCRPQPEPLRLRPEDVAYRLICEAAGERVEKFFYLRRDGDGRWRVLAF